MGKGKVEPKTRNEGWDPSIMIQQKAEEDEDHLDGHQTKKQKPDRSYPRLDVVVPTASRLGDPKELDRYQCRYCGFATTPPHWGNECPQRAATMIVSAQAGGQEPPDIPERIRNEAQHFLQAAARQFEVVTAITKLKAMPTTSAQIKAEDDIVKKILGTGAPTQPPMPSRWKTSSSSSKIKTKPKKEKVVATQDMDDDSQDYL